MYIRRQLHLKNTTDSNKVKFQAGYLLTHAVYSIKAVIHQTFPFEKSTCKYRSDPGNYDLIRLYADEAGLRIKVGFDTITVEGVEIIAGNRTLQNFTLSPAEPEEEE
jgi:hypothetical protein